MRMAKVKIFQLHKSTLTVLQQSGRLAIQPGLESVRANRSDSLQSFITEFLEGVKTNLKINISRFKNNLTSRQRDALTSLASDKSVVINSKTNVEQW